MRLKEKIERVLNVDNDKIFEIATHTYVYFLNGSLFPKLREYHQFHIYQNVPRTQSLPMWISVPL